MEIQPYNVGHLDAIELRHQEQVCLALDPNGRQKMQALAQFGTGGAIVHNGLVIAVIGYYEMWPGCFELWSFPSVHIYRYAKMYIKTVKQYIHSIERDLNPMRIQTTAYDDDLHTRWMTYLGFSNETPFGMKNYNICGSTFNMWAKTYEVTL